MAYRMRQFCRALRLLVHLTAGLLLSVLLLADPCRTLDAKGLMSWWCRGALDILGIDWQVQGAALEGPRLTVANHVSWLDILLIGANEPTRFVAKSEIADWPVAGWLARASGTFFIERGNAASRKTADAIAEHLDRNGNVTLFPEGTTTVGNPKPRFHARLFGASIEAQVPVQPAAICYGRSEAGVDIAPFVNDDALLPHLLRIMREPRLKARLIYLPAIDPRDRTRQQLAKTSAGQIAAALANAQTI